MLESKLPQEMAQKEVDAEEIADKIIKKPELLSEIFQGLSADKARIKYGCAKVLRIISEKEPEVLYLSSISLSSFLVAIAHSCSGMPFILSPI